MRNAVLVISGFVKKIKIFAQLAVELESKVMRVFGRK